MQVWGVWRRLAAAWAADCMPLQAPPGCNCRRPPAAAAARRKAEAVAAALAGGRHQFAFLHVKAVDDTGHDYLTDMKVRRLHGPARGARCRGHSQPLARLVPRRGFSAAPQGQVLAPCRPTSAAADRPLPPSPARQPRYQEVVDRMVGQLVRRLWAAERDGNGRYRCAALASCAPRCQEQSWVFACSDSPRCWADCGTQCCSIGSQLRPWVPAHLPALRRSIVVTGDHSTPVQFGDHSHEPVPFAIAHVRHVVRRAALRCARLRQLSTAGLLQGMLLRLLPGVFTVACGSSLLCSP